MNTMKHKISIVLATLALAVAVCATPFTNAATTKHYIIVAGQGLPKNEAAEVLKQTFVLLLER